MGDVLPMFPLGTVLVPSAGLPLHVFEPRYRALVHDCLQGGREFGVVLIARGSEVGGGDVRTDVGTVARILDAVELSDGRWALGTVGLRRVRITRWLPDDPYPLAEVEDWPDPAPSTEMGDALEACVSLVRRALGLAAEAGDATAPATIELSDDPVLASYQAAAVAPIGAFDRQRLLAADSPDVRVALLAELARDAIAVLELRLGGADGG
ncbi:MAG: LON peptidase substrate-binding domain-containing protein [Acidimicrobiales bacterium]